MVVQVVGKVDGYTPPALEVCLQSQASQPGVRELVVYPRQVTFLGVAGVRCWRRPTAAAGGAAPSW